MKCWLPLLREFFELNKLFWPSSDSVPAMLPYSWFSLGESLQTNPVEPLPRCIGAEPVTKQRGLISADVRLEKEDFRCQGDRPSS
jgi:hypothetical protein